MRYLVAAFCVILLFSITAQAVSAVSGPSGHGCASPTPPGVPGSPAPAPAVSGIILINEVLLSPHSTWNCSETPGTYFSTHDAWIELYNTQNQPFNLYEAHALFDNGPNTNTYNFPLGTSIAAHAFLVVFPYTGTSPHFILTEMPTLRLVIPNVVIDQVAVPALGPDQSYARTSDGASSWEITSTPTIGASNTSLQVTPTATVSSGRDSSRSSRSKGSRDSSSRVSTDGSSTNATRGSYSRALINGVQPRWSTLQIPATTPTPVVDMAPAALSSTPASASSSLDLPRRIALTVSVIVLALALFWCWRLFKKRVF